MIAKPASKDERGILHFYAVTIPISLALGIKEVLTSSINMLIKETPVHAGQHGMHVGWSKKSYLCVLNNFVFLYSFSPLFAHQGFYKMHLL